MEKNIQDLKYSDITEKIIKAAFKVHTAIGPGFSEIIYQRALRIELELMELKCENEITKLVYYYEHIVGSRRLDLFGEDKVLVELKAIREMDNYEINQVINYLKVFKLEVGLLLNFGKPSLEIKRFVNSKVL